MLHKGLRFRGEGASIPATNCCRDSGFSNIPTPAGAALMKGCAAIFDLDGTLADTAPDLVNAANRLLAELGLPALEFRETRNAAGMGGRPLIRLGFRRGGRQLPSDGEMDALYARFLVVYDRGIDDSTRLYDGVVETLDGLRADRWLLGVCTNKPVAPAIRLLGRLGIGDYFGSILGGDSLAVRKPDPRHLLATIEAVGGEPRRSVMVGDSAADLGAARSAGLPCVLMRYGYSPEPVDSLGAEAVLDRFAELTARLPALIREGCTPG